MGDVDADALPKGTRNRPGRVNPAIGIENIFWNILAVSAINRVAHILPGSDDDGGGQEEGHGEVVVKPEDDIVRLHVAKFDQVLDSAEDTEHLKPDDQSLPFDVVRVSPVLSTYELSTHVTFSPLSLTPAVFSITPRHDLSHNLVFLALRFQCRLSVAPLARRPSRSRLFLPPFPLRI